MERGDSCGVVTRKDLNVEEKRRGPSKRKELAAVAEPHTRTSGQKGHGNWKAHEPSGSDEGAVADGRGGGRHMTQAGVLYARCQGKSKDKSNGHDHQSDLDSKMTD